MSGTNVDTSTAQQRIAFIALLEGTGGGALPAAAAAVQYCQNVLPLTAATLLGLPPGSTFAQGAAQIQFRWQNGEPAY